MKPQTDISNTDISNIDTSNIKNWDDLDLKNEILRGIYSYGFERPSDIQQKAILPIINKRDVIAQAQSGTGKTGSFSISALQRVDFNSNDCQALIIAPTRELVLQIFGVITNIGTFIDKLNVKTLIGGTSVSDDIHELKNKPPQIVVGTPGRIFDMIKRRKLNIYTVKLFMLDEADEMLSVGFKDQIQTIFQYFNESVQVAIFSATMPNDIIELSDKFMINPHKIVMKAEELSLEGIEQFYIATMNDEDKYAWIKNIFNKISVAQCIIFVNDVKRVIDLTDALQKDGFPVCCIHSSLTKSQRDEILTDFRNMKYNVMISSNITARGIDIQQVNIVINFDVPNNVHTYLHRIGRSGRWGRKGTAINFVSRRDIYTMQKIEKYYQICINEFSN